MGWIDEQGEPTGRSPSTHELMKRYFGISRMAKVIGGRLWPVALIGGIGLWLGAGCSSKHYRESADKEVYGILRQKTPLVPDMPADFTIETNQVAGLEDLPTVSQIEPALGTTASQEIGARILPLDRALEIAFKQSRTYQTRKETLYLEALRLTLTRHQFNPIFSGALGGGYQGSRSKAENVQAGVDRITEQHSVYGSPSLGFDMLLRSGARIATDFTADFFKYVIGGDPRAVTSGRLASSLTQPLLRGGGYRATMETLTQAERSLLYSMRTFVQYRREYAVTITQGYFRVLQNRDQMRNIYQSYQSFKTSADRQRAFVEVGQQKVSELGRLQQQEINSETSWISAIRTYQQSLDQFKITLGLPTEARLVLDDRDLEKLAIQHPSIEVEDALRIALANRLDLYTQRDRLEDAARQIDLAKNNLLPDLDFVLQASATTQPGTYLPELDYSRLQWSAGLNFDPDLDRKSERNSYRSSLISYQQSLRDLELAVDNIKLGVIDDWRQLDAAQRNYQSSELGVALSLNRVNEQNLLTELGRGTPELLVDAQNNYTQSRNQLTSALISHTIARLGLWRDLGILTVKENGQWEDITDVTKHIQAAAAR